MDDLRSAEPNEGLPFGLYERVVDRGLRELLDRLGERAHIEADHLDVGESHAILAQHLALLIQRALADQTGPERFQRQIALCNELLASLQRRAPGVLPSDPRLEDPVERLLAVLAPEVALERRRVERPETPLSISSLLTGTRSDPSLDSQLRKELLSADRVDFLCSFIKWSGVRILADELQQFARQPGARLRVITTTYMGATDPRAVEFLRALPNTEVRVSYDTDRTRLHAKAYLFHRATGFGTAYVGSSNLSNVALTQGLEWNVKLSQYESDHVWQKLCGTFETWWSEAEFVPYEEGDQSYLTAALRRERLGDDEGTPFFAFDVRPYPHQQILDRLAAEREYHARTRNLVVAATGTGKTVVAAFDYQRFRQHQQARPGGGSSRLLFVAHREEILKQSLECFRGVLRDRNFGELLVGPYRPDGLDHLFVSIQSYNSRGLADRLQPDYYDFVVVDEFHHAEAPTYQRLLDHLRPQVLLGLTATPERTDCRDVLRHFGGHMAAEIRLPAAINQKLLCPFQYFGVTDTEDLSQLSWRRGSYDLGELDRQFTGNDARADLVVRTVFEKLEDPRRACGIGFCVSVEHAEYMAAYFRRHGIPAEALSSQSPRDQRESTRRRLQAREINFVFVVDLYNEGVDIPEVDTVLFLRPTESLTVFLQQLGRGLRLAEGKDCLTVLDFIGQAHRSYGWEARFRALMDRPRKAIHQEIEDGCLHLPLGCVVRLEKVAQTYVLDNIRRAIGQGGLDELARRLRTFCDDTGLDPSLTAFLEHYGLEPDDIYRRTSWSRLCARAGLRPDFGDPDEVLLTKGLRRLAHLNSERQIRALRRLIDAGSPGSSEDTDEQLLLMLHVCLWREWRPPTVWATLERLSRNPTLRAELLDLLQLMDERLETVPPPLELPFASPLQLHARYTRDEILVALGCWTLSSPRQLREGVLHLPDLRTDAFFVTLNKTETEYSPTTLYEDYAISADQFHWQSQSTTSDASPTGQRYIHHAEREHMLLLFVREDKERNGLACPYDFLGPVTYERHTGSRPMSILWRLRHPMPARLLAVARRLAAA